MPGAVGIRMASTPSRTVHQRIAQRVDVCAGTLVVGFGCGEAGFDEGFDVRPVGVPVSRVKGGVGARSLVAHDRRCMRRDFRRLGGEGHLGYFRACRFQALRHVFKMRFIFGLCGAVKVVARYAQPGRPRPCEGLDVILHGRVQAVGVGGS